MDGGLPEKLVGHDAFRTTDMKTINHLATNVAPLGSKLVSCECGCATPNRSGRLNHSDSYTVPPEIQ